MKFFVLRNAKVIDGYAVTDFIPKEGSPVGEAPQCGTCSKFIGMLPLVAPVRVELTSWGDTWGDIAYGPGDQLLISEKLKSIVRNNQLRGITSLLPATIVGIKSEGKPLGQPPKYFLASIGVGGASIDDVASGMVREKPWTCHQCRLGGPIKSFEAIAIEPATWLGEDIFYTRGLPGIILVTTRFKEICEDNLISNANFSPAESFSMLM